MRNLSVLVFAVACSAAPGQPDEGPVAVSYVLSPAPELSEWTRRAAHRWNQATGCGEGSGCEFVVEPGGIPISYVDEILMPPLPDGTVPRANGVSQVSGSLYPGNPWRFIHVSADVKTPELTLVHELGHVRGLVGHTATGITQGAGRMSREQAVAIEAFTINDEALSAVCSKTLCLEFNVEEPVR